MGTELAATQQWVDVCDYQQLAPNRGVCALVGGRQVAIFRVSPSDELFAISNYDPFSQAFVLSRGIVGNKGDVLKVASPIYKQSFDLRTGQCLDDPDVRLPIYPVALHGGRVAVAVAIPSTSATAVATATPAINRAEPAREPAPGESGSTPASPASGVTPASPASGVTPASSTGRRSRAVRAKPLAGRKIALAEVREADLLRAMLADQGATTVSYPLVRIADSPEHQDVLAFVRDLADNKLDALVLLTGEGVRRLIGFAERAGLQEAVVSAMRSMTIVTRGPKPARALRELRILPTLSAEQPTTEGVIEVLQSREWHGARVGVQLCGQKPNDRLLRFLASAGASVLPVAPYVYERASDDDKVVQLIRHMATGEVDAVAFTCSAQVDRVFAVAEMHGVEETLRRGLRRTRVAALGPVVAAALRERDCRVDIIPARSFFMRSLTREIVTALKPPPRRASGDR